MALRRLHLLATAVTQAESRSSSALTSAKPAARPSSSAAGSESSIASAARAASLGATSDARGPRNRSFSGCLPVACTSLRCQCAVQTPAPHGEASKAPTSGCQGLFMSANTVGSSACTHLSSRRQLAHSGCDLSHDVLM